MSHLFMVCDIYLYISAPTRGEPQPPVSALRGYKSPRQCVLSAAQTYPKLSEIHKKIFETHHKTSCVQNVAETVRDLTRDATQTSHKRRCRNFLPVSQTMTCFPEPNHILFRPNSKNSCFCAHKRTGAQISKSCLFF